MTELSVYTFSKAIGSQVNDHKGIGVVPIQNPSLHKDRASYDRNDRYRAAVTCQLPLGRSKRFLNCSGVWNHVFGGYKISLTEAAESGNPLNFSFANVPHNNYPRLAGNRDLEVISASGIWQNPMGLCRNRFNTNIHSVRSVNDPANLGVFTVGNARRNTMVGLPLLWACASAKKDIDISGRFQLTIALGQADYFDKLQLLSVHHHSRFPEPENVR